jgi:hypothetical protein
MPPKTSTLTERSRTCSWKGYVNFQDMIDKAIVIESKLKEIEKDGKRKMSFSGQSSRRNVRPRFSQPNQFFKPLLMNRTQILMQMHRPQFQV